MQGKGVIKFFAVILALACIYQLSFTWVAHKVENDARTYAKGDTTLEKAYLDSISTQPVYPLLGHTYQYCLENELALGLDLKGGMNVTMQISLQEVVKGLSNNNPDPIFNQALVNATNAMKNSQTDYVTLFVKEYEKLNPNGKLAAIFSTKDNQANLKYNASNSDVEKYLKSEAETAVQQSFTVLNTRIDQFGVTQPNISMEKQTQRILIELPGVKDPARVRKLLSGTAELEFYETFQSQESYPVLSGIEKLLAAKNKAAVKQDTAKTETVAATLDTVKKDGLSLINKVQKNPKDTSATALRSKMAEEYPLLSVLRYIFNDASGQPQLMPGPIAGIALLKDTAKVNSYLNSADVKNNIPRNMKFLWSVKPRKDTKEFELYAIKLSGAENGPVLSGDVINDARNVTDQRGNPEVEMTMNSAGAQKWRTITAAAAATSPKKAIAIVLDGNVYSAPTVQNEISGGVSSISGDFTVDDTKDLANVLKAGRLDAPARIIGEDVVGPSLGQESINDGLISCVLGLVVVLVFMIAYYNRAGTVAVVAVIINVFFLIGVLTSLHAVLTLPGIAGIVLTLGMAVDANVLIYERIREELSTGKSLRLAVNDGFKHALATILDSNVTTFLTGVILFAFGSGPIQGFATTLMIGIATSLFTALLISRLIFEWLLDKGSDIKFSNPWSANTFKNANYAFVKNRSKFYIFSTVFIVAGLISIFVQGFNYGVDFQGGRTYVIHFQNKNATVEDVRDAVEDALGRGTQIKTYGTDKISITTNYLVEDNTAATDTKVEQLLITTLNKKAVTQMSKKDIVSSQKVQATIADGLRKSAIWTVVLAILVIAVYILVRFRKWSFSIAAMIATAHDALIVVSFFSLFKDVIPFLEVDQAFIAAVLTVVGYSINDTVVVFDRIREHLNQHHTKEEKTEDIVNSALNSTLSRTIITALTVLFVLIVLFLFGGDVIRGFSFALLIGVVFGVYSSLCVASPIIVDLGKKSKK